MHSSQTIGQFSTCHFFLSLLETRVGKHWQPPFFIKQFQILSTFISFGGLYKHNNYTNPMLDWKGLFFFSSKSTPNTTYFNTVWENSTINFVWHVLFSKTKQPFIIYKPVSFILVSISPNTLIIIVIIQWGLRICYIL